MSDQVSIGLADFERLLGQKEVVIYALQKQLAAAHARISELEKKGDT